MTADVGFGLAAEAGLAVEGLIRAAAEDGRSVLRAPWMSKLPLLLRAGPAVEGR